MGNQQAHQVYCGGPNQAPLGEGVREPGGNIGTASKPEYIISAAPLRGPRLDRAVGLTESNQSTFLCRPCRLLIRGGLPSLNPLGPDAIAPLMRGRPNLRCSDIRSTVSLIVAQHQHWSRDLSVTAWIPLQCVSAMVRKAGP